MNDFKVRYDMKEVKEIHDRIIVATARFYKADVVTKDKLINESGAVEDLSS
jgi:PIN domain nuclease of toxin-antitoxin system